MINVIVGAKPTNLTKCLSKIDLPLILETIDDLKDIKHKRNYNFVFLKSTEDLRKFKKKFSSKLFDNRGYYVIILLMQYFGIDEFFKWWWDNQILNVNALWNGHVFTYYPFTSTECSSTTPQITGNFINNSHPLSSFAHFFPDKISNLKGCAVRIATSKVSPPYVHVKMSKNGTIEKIYGRDISLINTLSQIINFKVDYTYVGTEGALYSDGRAAGPFEMLLTNKADLIVAEYWLMISRLKYVDCTLPYIISQTSFIIPPSAPISSYEILIMPFDCITWICLSSLLSISIIFIFGMRIMPKIFNMSSYDPYLDIIRAILGGSQTKLPTKNFYRILLMVFLLFCLIMRTLYQAKFYILLQSDMVHKQMERIDEIVERKLDVYYHDAMRDLMTSLKFDGRLKEVTFEERIRLFDKIHDSSFKGVIPRSLMTLLYHNQVNYNTSKAFSILKEKFLTTPVVIYTRKDFYLNNKINENIQRIQAAGLMEYWHSSMVDRKFLDIKPPGGAKQLKLSHFESCFGILLIGLIIAFMTFVIEIIRRS